MVRTGVPASVPACELAPHFSRIVGVRSLPTEIARACETPRAGLPYCVVLMGAAASFRQNRQALILRHRLGADFPSVSFEGNARDAMKRIS